MWLAFAKFGGYDPTKIFAFLGFGDIFDGFGTCPTDVLFLFVSFQVFAEPELTARHTLKYIPVFGFLEGIQDHSGYGHLAAAFG